MGMDIRVDCHFDGQNTFVSIAGRLSGTAIGQIQEALDQIQSPLVVDLSNLIYADNEGIETIRAIIDEGAHVQGASPFIALLLEDTPG